MPAPIEITHGATEYGLIAISVVSLPAAKTTVMPASCATLVAWLIGSSGSNRRNDEPQELLATRQVSDAHFKAMADRFGERGVVELVGLMGQYHTLTMLFAIDRYPLPEGARQEIDRPK